MVQLTRKHLAQLPNLQAVCYSAGSVKPFVSDESYARGVRITTAMHANAIPVAETTMALDYPGQQGLVCLPEARPG